MTESPYVFVTTYAAHNSINGSCYRLELDDFDDFDEFMTHCSGLFSNESDPSIMFVDWSSCLKSFIIEHGIDPIAFKIAELNKHDREVIAAFYEVFDTHNKPESEDHLHSILNRFKGNFATGGDFAEHQWGENAESQGIELTGLIGQLAIDWERTWDADFGFEYVKVKFLNQNHFFENTNSSSFDS